MQVAFYNKGYSKMNTQNRDSMKQHQRLLILLFALCLGVANAWAAEATVTLTHSNLGLSASYKEATATVDNFDFTIDQGYKGATDGGCIQMNKTKGNGILYNTTPIPGLKSITVNVVSGSKIYTITTGTSVKPTTEAGNNSTTSTINVKNAGDTYFQLKVSGASYFSSIVITYETSTSPCTQLATPTNLVVKNITNSTADISWDAVENAAKYRITTTPPAFASSATYTTTETTYNATGLSPETTYTWTVKAIGDGTTYCDSEESTSGTFTTPAKPKYTITWRTPLGTTTTQVTQGEKIGTLPAEPTAPIGCSDKVFMGWSATNIGTTGTDVAPAFISAETIPTANTTYYAVFATKEGNGVAGWTLVTSESDLVVGQIYTIASSATPNSGKVLGEKNTNNYQGAIWTDASTTPTELTLGGSTNAWTLNDGTGYLYAASSKSNHLKAQETNDENGQWSITFSSNAAIIKAQGTNTRNIIRYNSTNNIFSCYASGQGAVYLFKYSTGSTYTDYVTNCVDCTAPTTALALSVTNATLNLGEDGTAKTTFSTIGGNGGMIDYVVNPAAGATLDKDNKTITFTQAGTYTLTAQQDLNTTDGTIYCGSRISQTITVTSIPVLYFTTTPADPIEFPEVECGGNTPLSQKQQISLQGYNLTGDVSVAVTGDYKIARTASAALGDYTTELTLPKTTEGKINATYSSVYVLSCPPAQGSSATNGTLTITTDKGNTLTVNLSTPTVTCKEYTLTLNDRGNKNEVGSYYAGATVSQPADPTGVCTEPINYVFDGWATAEVADGSTSYTRISFPYAMPNANTTLYAVYKYSGGEGISKVSVADIVDGGRYYITAVNNGTAYILKAGKFSAKGSGTYTDTFDEETVTEDMAWTFVKSNNEWSIQSDGNKLGTSNDNNGLSSSTSNDGTWTCEATTTGSTTVKLTYPSNNNRILSLYDGQDWRTYTGNNGVQAIQLYSATAYYYTTSPSCGPRISGMGDVAITSGKGIWVESVTPLTISAKNLDKNDDNAAVTITATVTDDAVAKGFSIKTTGTQNKGTTNVTLASDHSNATWDGTLTVVYTPTEDNVMVEGKIALRVYKSGGSTTYATDTIVVRGRSLPAEFVLAAKTADGWVALPSDLGIGSTSALKVPYSITVNDEDNPTLAIQAPTTTIYTSAERSAKNTAATAIRLKNANNRYLQGSTSDGQTNVWLSNQNSEQAQSWELRTEDFAHYFVRMQASEAGRYLSYDATQGKIGNYKQMSSLHILPVENTCVRFDAPVLDVQSLTSTAVTLRWLSITEASTYEYSMDNGTTWNECTNTQTTGTEVKWTIDGLFSTQTYTIYVRVRVTTGDNCSAHDSETFTTPDCDDIPTDLWASVTANTATISWTCQATNATIRIYSDAEGNTMVQEITNASSPSTIHNLTQNTTYYYQILADGTCGSAIAHFTTESNDVSIIEWEPDGVVVDINTELDGVSIIVENQTAHGTQHSNIADDLFFSKYYEASGNLKLVAIYNGTRDTLPLTNIQLKVGTSKWNTIIQMNQYGKFKAGHIAPDEEIIIWHKSKYTSTNDCVASTMDVSIMNENTSLSFAGRASIGLFRSGDLIDIIGAGTIATSIEGTCRPSWGDANGWCGSGYNIENPTEEIELSTNRCLLVRSNKVKSGANAVANNTSTFATLTKEEWLGRQVPNDDDTEEATSCAGFAYVADFNYDDYYIAYDSVGALTELDGKHNPDGTFTIPVNRLDTMACSKFRILLKKDGKVVATKEQKVPIIIKTDATTADETYFRSTLTEEICKTCDIVVCENAKLTHTTGGRGQFNNLDIYTGSRLEIPSNLSMTLGAVRMYATNDTVSYAIINNSDAADASIAVKQVVHIKRIDGRYWYPFSLPYDCNIADIHLLNGQSIGTYGVDWGIKFYDGQRRQNDGNSTTPAGAVSKYWTMMPEDGRIAAHTGYIIGLFGTNEAEMKSICFTPATESNYTENSDSKVTHIQNYHTANLQTSEPRHHGWNFVGSPYISLFGSTTEGEGLYNPQLQMGYTDSYGQQQDADHIYVSIPDGGNTNTYTQQQASATTIKPFTAYFVQAIDPTDGVSHTLDLTYSKQNRSLPAAAPYRTIGSAERTIFVELNLTHDGLSDNTGILVSDRYSTNYEIGSDLTKMYAAGDKPQLFTTDVAQSKMAYQSLPDMQAHHIPLGIYTPSSGDYTLSINEFASDTQSAGAVYLLYKGSIVANLLYSDYSLTSTARGLLNGYSLDIQRSTAITTGAENSHRDTPHILSHDGMLTIDNIPAGADIHVYDILGRTIVYRTVNSDHTLTIPAYVTGIWTICVTTENSQFVQQIIIR